MKTTLIQHGDSLAVVLDKPTVEKMNLTPDSLMDIITDGRVLRLEPATDEKQDDMDELKRANEEILEEYAETFKKLAK